MGFRMSIVSIRKAWPSSQLRHSALRLGSVTLAISFLAARGSASFPIRPTEYWCAAHNAMLFIVCDQRLQLLFENSDRSFGFAQLFKPDRDLRSIYIFDTRKLVE